MEPSSLIYKNALNVNVVMTVMEKRLKWRKRMGVGGGTVRCNTSWMFIHASGPGATTRLQGAITGITPIGPWDCGMAAILVSGTVNMLQVE